MTVDEGIKAFGAMTTMFNVRSVHLGAKVEFTERELVPTVTNGSETGGMRMDERHKLNVMKMKCKRSKYRGSSMDRGRNEEARHRVVLSLRQRVERVEAYAT